MPPAAFFPQNKLTGFPRLSLNPLKTFELYQIGGIEIPSQTKANNQINNNLGRDREKTFEIYPKVFKSPKLKQGKTYGFKNGSHSL